MKSSTTKESYKAFISENYVPIFFRDYFLDAVCDGKWDAVLYQEKDKIKAAYVYMLKQKFFLKYIVQPQLCPYTGPIFFGESDTQEAYDSMISRLPHHHLIIQDYFHSIPKSIENSNTSLKKHTYLIDKDTDIDELWGLQSSTHRRIIRKAERELKYMEEPDIDLFLNFVSVTFDKRRKEVPNDPKIFRKLDQILDEKQQRKIVKCINSDNKVVAMCYFMKDENWTYNFANGIIEDYRHYGMNLIIWNEIKVSLSEQRSFDFEGSMIPGVDEFFKRYKGKKTHYITRYKSNNSLVDLLVRIKQTKHS